MSGQDEDEFLGALSKSILLPTACGSVPLNTMDEE
jgi:hypothetical protein